MGEELNSEYQAALDYILSFADYERASRSAVVFDLRRIEELLARLANPHLSARSIHIAGTKGKGSTAAMIAAGLAQAGYKTGLYTSPHLHTLRERMRINGKLISEQELVGLVDRLKPEIMAINERGDLGELTTFEILTALAFSYFEQNKVDFQVLETGLGGRLDATNVVKGEVCVITSISLDHMEVLGYNLHQIAKEKAGIIKPGCIVICSPQFPEAAEVIEEECHNCGVKLVRVGKEVIWQRQAFSLKGQSCLIKGMKGSYELDIPLLGEHQLDNAASAVACLEVLNSLGVKISANDIISGLAQVDWPGRLQVLRQDPLLIADGAHNADSARKLKQALKQYFDFEQLILIVGTSEDKDIPGIIRELASLGGSVIVTRSRHPRAASLPKLVAEFSKWGIVPQVVGSVAAAVDQGLTIAKPNDLICATGSLFVVAEVIEYTTQRSSLVGEIGGN
jgi:dihydrofolate synthase/folylpolyglutamate synthase